jgi:ABC-type lipoprotein release transport system permease subunit
MVGDFSRDLMLNAVSDLAEVVEFTLTEGRTFSSDDAHEVIFSSIDDVPVKVGDRITIRSGSSDHTFEVVGLLNRMTIGIAYIPMGTARKILTEKYHGFFADTDLPPEKIKEVVYTDENVGWIQPKGDIKKAVFGYLAQARVITRIALWVSIFLAILFLLTGVTINIREREGEYATLASLGYSNGFLGRVILTETVLLGLIGILLSVPLSYLFSVYLNREMGEAWIELDLYLDARDVIEVMVFAFLFLPVAALPSLRNILTMDIPLAVRRRSFG